MTPGPTRLVVLVLAAGRSRRFGTSDKLTALVGVRPMAWLAARNTDGVPCLKRLAVTRNPTVAGMFKARGFSIVPAQHHRCSQSESLRLGLGHARQLGASHVLVLLADMPFLTKKDILAVSTGRQYRPAIAAEGRQTLPPAVIPRFLFPSIERLSGDAGAGTALRQRPNLREVFLPSDHLTDIDRRAEGRMFCRVPNGD